MTGPREWWKSKWDEQRHVFLPARFADQPYREAMCGHSAPLAQIDQTHGPDDWCMACMLRAGTELADEGKDPGGRVQ